MRRCVLVWLCVSAWTLPAAGGPKELRALAGARVRVTWVQDLDKHGRDVFARGRNLRLMACDSDDGRGERVLLGGPGSFVRPRITPGGDRVVFSDRTTGKTCVVGFDGSGRRDVCDGIVMDVWRDPADGSEWVFVGTKRGRGKGTTFSRVERVRLEKPGTRRVVWERTNVSADGFGVSADGRMASGLLPWPSAERMDLAGRTHEKYGRGCWTCLAPDNSYLAWVFDGPHRGVRVHDMTGGAWKVDVSGCEGVRGFEVYHPRWSNHVRLLAVTGPYLGKGGKPGGNRIGHGGSAVEVHVGRFSEDLRRVEQWVRVTRNRRGDFYPDVWVAGGEKASLPRRVAPRPVEPPRPEKPVGEFDDWPGSPAGLVFCWQDAKGANRVPAEGDEPIPCRLRARGRVRFGRFYDMLLADGAFLAEDADERVLNACRATGELTVEAVLTPADLKQSGPARIVTFSESPSSRNFTLGQQGDRLVFRLRTPSNGSNGCNSEPKLCRLEADRPHHVIVSYADGRLACYLNGKRVYAGRDIRGSFANWTKQHLLFGDEWTADRDWRGRLEGVAIYCRAVGPDEARKKHELYARRLADRKPARTVEVTARLVEATATPSPEAIQPYVRCLAVYTYEIATVHRGRCASRRIGVAHWVILDGKRLGFRRKVGRSYRMTLEDMGDHPQIDNERLVSDEPYLDLDMYVEAAP